MFINNTLITNLTTIKPGLCDNIIYNHYIIYIRIV